MSFQDSEVLPAPGWATVRKAEDASSVAMEGDSDRRGKRRIRHWTLYIPKEPERKAIRKDGLGTGFSDRIRTLEIGTAFYSGQETDLKPGPIIKVFSVSEG